MNRTVVAIDGPSGAGKSTIARRVAGRLGFVNIDTGAMYRAVALWAERSSVPLDDSAQLGRLAARAGIVFPPGETKVLLNGEDVTAEIRRPEMAQSASKVSAVPEVREALVEKQRAMSRAFNVVMEGRDIGTVVFPEADLKVYLDAEPRVRALRRVADLRAAGVEADAGQVEREMRERDERDRNRQVAPLRQAADAVFLDSSAMTVEEVEEAILKLVRERTSCGKEAVR